ncbi:hypothetical protein FRACYDRAFT_244744 [Fragilariopsis cylindrus CCMP1102]|uniref:F-box domain-containing protein n=1 Tax=Fragilariopsis cylindrus CCMP1102 TaxID=635003 RepID=A0A1E7F0L0_9STRA|nr:hypothetical protein FRACYDRAFT_244744 [Fragilariopsis cylindrus CCMP1102]|eukprot:OEU11626.1 hypothetical protein FRACYDRAFT_244744 [Fragilariopsis cylindrus CCMP1102]
MASSTVVNEMSNSNMKDFSREIHIAIASFLGVNDVFNYQSCNKQLRRMINLHRLNKPSRIDFIGSELQMYQGVDRKLRMEKIIGSSFYFSNLIHSVKLSCYYCYQGWGNLKGQISIIETPNHKEQQQSEKDQEQQQAKFELIFRPKPGFMYCLSYPYGNGDGNTIIVRDIKLESFVHSACIPLANTLMDARTSQQSLFHRNMLQYVLDTVVYFDNSSETHCQQQQQEILERPSLSFFQSMGLNLMDEHDVEAVRMLLVELESN